MKDGGERSEINNVELLANAILTANQYFLTQVQRQVDTALTLRNWIIGFYILKYEQFKLPLKEGYKQDNSIYDYNPSGKMGIIKASINDVSNGTYESINSGSKEVWVVTVSDEIGNNDNGFMTYYINKKDRRFWKQEINIAGRKMMMQRKEL